MPYLFDVYQELATNSFTIYDWLERIGDEQPGGGEAFTLESGEATVVCQVPWQYARSFVRYVLGFSYADAGAPYRLRRENPVRHPRFSWLTASSVSFSSFAPKGVAGVGTKVNGAFPGGLPVAAYNMMWATVRFTDHPWTFLPDAQATTPADEAQRNTYFDPVPSVEIISAEGLNNLAFAFTSGTGGTGGPPSFPSATKDIGIPAPFGTLMSKIAYTLNWMWVPQEYISGPDTLVFSPTNILSCVGRVNTLPFLDFPAGTLLLQAPQFTRFKFPILTSDGIYSFYGWNIKLPFQFFDPTRGGIPGTMGTGSVTTATSTGLEYPAFNTAGTATVTWNSGADTTQITVTSATATTVNFSGSTNGVPTSGTSVVIYNDSFRGHQLIPYRPNLLWYPCVRQDMASKLYPEADMNMIFKNPMAP